MASAPAHTKAGILFFKCLLLYVASNVLVASVYCICFVTQFIMSIELSVILLKKTKLNAVFSVVKLSSLLCFFQCIR